MFNDILVSDILAKYGRLVMILRFSVTLDSPPNLLRDLIIFLSLPLHCHWNNKLHFK